MVLCLAFLFINGHVSNHNLRDNGNPKHKKNRGFLCNRRLSVFLCDNIPSICCGKADPEKSRICCKKGCHREEKQEIII